MGKKNKNAQQHNNTIFAFGRCVECAQDALDGSLKGDMIFLCAGQHNVSGAGGLAAGGELRGDSRSGTSVVGSPNSQTMFDFSPGSRKVGPWSWQPLNFDEH